MRLLKFHLCILLVLLGFTSGLYSCNPVKQVLNDPQKFAQVRDTVFARGLCLNDTVTTQVVRDTTIYKEVTGRADSTRVQTQGTCNFSTIVKGTKVTYRNGVLTVIPKTLHEVQLKTVVQTNTVRDKSREGVLEKQLVQVEASAKERYDKLNHDTQELRVKVEKRNTQRLGLLLVVVALGAWNFRKPLLALFV